jgi:hypothetical protein
MDPSPHTFSFLSFFWWDWGLNSELYSCKAGALTLEPHFALVMLEMGLENYLPGLALNHDSPNLSLISS